MKVGVDARLLSRPRTGIGRYTYEMCKSLSKIENISLYLYSPAPITLDILDEISFKKYRSKTWENPLLRQLWGETYLPYWANEDEIDVFWGPAHRLPFLLKKSIASVVTIHDLVWKFASKTMRPLSLLLEKYQMPLAVNKADMVVADSLATTNAIADEYKFEQNKIKTIYLAASLTLDGQSEFSLNNINIEKPYFLFVGTLEPRKNLKSLLIAYAKLPNEIKQKANLIIVGGKGWGGVDLENEILRLELSEYVSLLGFVNDVELAYLYNSALFLAMPSLYEGFGLPLLEAMSFGTPVLTSDNSSMPEVAGEAGLLVNANDVSSIKDGLERLISDDELQEKLAGKTKTQAAKFDWDKSAHGMLVVFEEVISVRNKKLL